MDQLPPLIDRVGQFGVEVAEDFFPRGGIMGPAGLEVEVEEPRRALFGQQPEARNVARGRHRERLGRLDGGDVA